MSSAEKGLGANASAWVARHRTPRQDDRRILKGAVDGECWNEGGIALRGSPGSLAHLHSSDLADSVIDQPRGCVRFWVHETIKASTTGLLDA